MVKINEATDTDLKIIEELYKLGWKRGDTLLYQQEYNLTSEQKKYLRVEKVLDFVGLCEKMKDNGKGTEKKNEKIITLSGGTTSQSAGSGTHSTGRTGIIDNSDPAHLIQRIYLHGDKIQVIDNIPIEEARKFFEEELQKTDTNEVVEIKKRVERNIDYEPEEQDIEVIKNWTKNPKVYLDELQATFRV